ncbi:uncharacterized protein SPPG_00511 [Spizellomyces punctatus DAOM BR117]|uniref:Calcofluor white hypersensitive protein n=1 Tax=Spizellomyces punctatus (strain DAOM BR117) TaxID=645134 RepID=A0A0L0HUL0_SPIPD|nr:uncharacterized protein SPPG_00511 [Spizellomyces punctatus DAOM BR117]KND04808.1 hypothetical protein SPPG_00511 [Spizellomyces punctatus DAOM BR117]|eukprot:XP_016612847.1 hypothetical protein SPPG_00511 [Spizellomyces punctatus DAOM BR117]
MNGPDLRQRVKGNGSADSKSPADSGIDLHKKLQRPGGVTIPATVVPYLHTVLGYAAFAAALAVCSHTRWHNVLKNEVAGWPEEWFPSVSAVTGDWYPARNIFQILIAMAAGPRFLLLAINYLVHDVSMSTGSRFVARLTLLFGLIRTLSCGGWVYITSTDQHDWHDIFMITYLVAGLFYMIGLTWLSWRSSKFGKQTGWKLRLGCIIGFLGLVPFLVYWFVKHKVDRIPGAYSIYALFEWSVILFDVGFDFATALDVKDISIQLVQPSSNSGPAGYTRIKQEPSLETMSRPQIVIEQSTLSTLSSHVADTYLGFVFWSMTTSLGLTIWYFPLWNMGISGFEAFLFTTLSPAVLGVPFIRRAVHCMPGIFHLLSLVGLLSYRFPEPLHRLICVGTGVGFSFLVWGSSFVDADGISSERVQSRSWSKCLPFMLGLLLSNVAKVYGFSNNPVWSIMRPENGGLNELGLGLAVLASLQVLLRPLLESKSKVASITTPEEKIAAKQGVKEARATGHWAAAAVGFGALLFALHSMLTDSGIICRWATDGYPNPGMDPLFGGVIVLLQMGIGLLISKNVNVATNTGWWLLGSTGVMALYFLPQWSTEGRYIGFGGGLIFATYICSIAPSLINQLPYFPAGRTLLLATFVYDILQLAHVWVVAYAFVPGGVYARERTHYLLIVMQFLLFVGLRSARSTLSSAEKREAPVSVHKTVRHEYDRAALTLAISYLLLAASVGARMSVRKEPKPYHPEEKLATMGIWTVHFGLDNEMWSSHQRMAEVIRELELDVIGLLESDTYRIIMGNRDLTQYLSETLGMYADYGPGPTKHTWGCSMLSKFPIIRSTHHLLPSPVGELACAIHATLDVYGTEVDVSVSHNGQEEDWLDRQLQTQTLAGIMNNSQNPFVFLGYVVTDPGHQHELYHTLVGKGRVEDIDETDWDRWCQYIFYRGLERVGYARISHGGITDTEIQVGKFVLPPEGGPRPLTVVDEDDDARIPEGQRFPEAFWGDGVRGHRYHVFDAPKYWGEMNENTERTDN